MYLNMYMRVCVHIHHIIINKCLEIRIIIYLLSVCYNIVACGITLTVYYISFLARFLGCVFLYTANCRVRCFFGFFAILGRYPMSATCHPSRKSNNQSDL